MQKSRKKKGFTLTELAIVIAVIAILIAVLVPTFTSLISKARESSDSQLAKNMNTLLATAEAEGDTPETMEDVNYILTEGGYLLENLNPTADGNVFVWNENTNRISYIDEENTVIYAGDTSLTADGEFTGGNNYWITVKSVSEFTAWSDYTLSYYIASDVFKDYTITLTGASSVHTGSYSVGEINYSSSGSNTATPISSKTAVNGNNVKKATSDTVDPSTATVRGSVTTVKVENSSISVKNYATVATVTLTNVNTYTEIGNTTTLNVTTGVTSVVIDNNGYVGTISGSVSSSSVVTNSGYIGTIDSSLTSYVTATASSYAYEISSYSDLVSFRNKVNNGNPFTNITVKLTANIDISGVDWVPIGFDNRDHTYTKSDELRTATATTSYKYFGGIFDGNGKTISGLSNTGFTPTVSRSDTYGADLTAKGNYLYGLFGIINGATIQNLTLTNVNIVEETDTDVGDSVGAIAGYAIGSVTVSGCTVSGSIVGADAAGGIIGRVLSLADTAATVNITNCTNNATVTTTEGKAGGMVGFYQAFVTGCAINITGCVNTGNVTSNATDPSYAYAAGMIVASGSSTYYSYTTITLKSCTNSGAITTTITGNNGKAGSMVTTWKFSDNSSTYPVQIYSSSCSNSGTISSNGTTYDFDTNYGASTTYSSVGAIASESES